MSGRNVYDPYRSKSTKLRNPAKSIFDRYITFCFNARMKTNGQVTTKDLLLMEAVMNGDEVNTTSFLIRKIEEIKDLREISMGMLITFFCNKLNLEIIEIDTLGKVKFDDSHLLNGCVQQKTGMVRLRRNGEWEMIPFEGEERQGDETKSFSEGTPLADRGKRTKTEARSSSMPPKQLDEIYEKLKSHFDEGFERLGRQVNERFLILSNQMSEVTNELRKLRDYMSNPLPEP